MGMDHEHRDVFIRKHVIEKRKQEAEITAQRREVSFVIFVLKFDLTSLSVKK
jgi:hypothetical protein